MTIVNAVVNSIFDPKIWTDRRHRFAVIFLIVPVVAMSIWFFDQTMRRINTSYDQMNKQGVPAINDLNNLLSADVADPLASTKAQSMPDIQLASAKMPALAGSVSTNGPSHGSPLYRVYRRVWYSSGIWYVSEQWYKLMRYGECKALRARAHNSLASCRIYYTYSSNMRRIYRPQVSASVKTSAGVSPMDVMPSSCSWVWWGQNSMRVQSFVWYATVYSQFYTDDKAGCNLVDFTRVSCLSGGALWAITTSRCDANPGTNLAFLWSDVEFGQEFNTSFVIKDQGPVSFSHTQWANIDPHTGELVNVDFH